MSSIRPVDSNPAAALEPENLDVAPPPVRSSAPAPSCADNHFAFVASAPPEGTGTVEDQAYQATLNGALSAAALFRTGAGLTPIHLQAMLATLGRNAPIPGEPTATADYTSQSCAPPEKLFQAFLQSPDKAFGAADLTLHPNPRSLTNGARFFIEDRTGPVPIWAPVEVKIDYAQRTITFTTLDGHPIRGVNRFEFKSDGAGGSRVKQHSEFQGSSALPTAVGVHVLGALDRQHEIWQGVHGHLAGVGSK